MANIVITPTEFTVENDIIINGIIDDNTVTKINVNGSPVNLSDSTFSINLGKLDAKSYSLPIEITDGNSAGETINIEFTVSAAQKQQEESASGEESTLEGTPSDDTSTEQEQEEASSGEVPAAPGTSSSGGTSPKKAKSKGTSPSQSVNTDNGKYTGVTEQEEALEDQKFYDKIMEGFGSHKFIPDYIPGKKIPVDINEIKTTLGGDSLYNPIETLDQRFPPRRNLKDSHGQLFGDRYHPDMVDKGETPIKEVDRFTASSIGTSGFTI